MAEGKHSSCTIPIINNHNPPQWALIELNGELIGPIEFPTKEKSVEILGHEDRVELGKLQLAAENVSRSGCLVFLVNSYCRFKTEITYLYAFNNSWNLDTCHDSRKPPIEREN
jgi:hypothetical protein